MFCLRSWYAINVTHLTDICLLTGLLPEKISDIQKHAYYEKVLSKLRLSCTNPSICDDNKRKYIKLIYVNPSESCITTTCLHTYACNQMVVNCSMIISKRAIESQWHEQKVMLTFITKPNSRYILCTQVQGKSYTQFLKQASTCYQHI